VSCGKRSAWRARPSSNVNGPRYGCHLWGGPALVGAQQHRADHDRPLEVNLREMKAATRLPTVALIASIMVPCEKEGVESESCRM